MEKKIINIPVEVLSPEELSPADRELVESAKQFTDNSYAPYSRFHVGAALRMEDGRIVCGANQENAAFPSGTCAERTACFYASANYPGKAIRKIAVAAREADPGAPFQSQPISPCGACRQALLEYEHLYGPIEVLLYGESGIYRLPSVASLLPFSFTGF